VDFARTNQPFSNSIAGFDHHCLWLNNCVGRKNYKAFVGLLVSLTIFLVIQTAVDCYVIYRMVEVGKFHEGSDSEKTAFAFAIIYLVLLLIALGNMIHLLGFHMMLIARGQTTYEYLTENTRIIEERKWKKKQEKETRSKGAGDEESHPQTIPRARPPTNSINSQVSGGGAMVAS